MSRRTAPVAVIDTMGVDTGYARQGVGRALLRELFASLRGAVGTADFGASVFPFAA